MHLKIDSLGTFWLRNDEWETAELEFIPEITTNSQIAKPILETISLENFFDYLFNIKID